MCELPQQNRRQEEPVNESGSEETLEEIQDRLIEEIEEEPEWLRKEIEEELERWANPRGILGWFGYRTHVP